MLHVNKFKWKSSVHAERSGGTSKMHLRMCSPCESPVPVRHATVMQPQQQLPNFSASHVHELLSTYEVGLTPEEFDKFIDMEAYAGELFNASNPLDGHAKVLSSSVVDNEDALCGSKENVILNKTNFVNCESKTVSSDDKQAHPTVPSGSIKNKSTIEKSSNKTEVPKLIHSSSTQALQQKPSNSSHSQKKSSKTTRPNPQPASSNASKVVSRLTSNNKTQQSTTATSANTAECVKTIWVLQSRIGRVIGQAGCTVNALRKLTGVHIDISKQSEPQHFTGDNQQAKRQILLRGSSTAAIEHACDLIQQLVAGRISSKKFMEDNAILLVEESLSSLPQMRVRDSSPPSSTRSHGSSTSTDNTVPPISILRPTVTISPPQKGPKPLPILSISKSPIPPPPPPPPPQPTRLSSGSSVSHDKMNFAKAAVKGLFPTSPVAQPEPPHLIPFVEPLSSSPPVTTASSESLGLSNLRQTALVTPMQCTNFFESNGIIPSPQKDLTLVYQPPTRPFCRAPGSDRPLTQKRSAFNSTTPLATVSPFSHLQQQSPSSGSSVDSDRPKASSEICAAVYGLFPLLTDPSTDSDLFSSACSSLSPLISTSNVTESLAMVPTPFVIK